VLALGAVALLMLRRRRAEPAMARVEDADALAA
jgi:hypothetical protein